ncbi:RING-H2 finger protein ATL52-like [Salvia miltiorrhiza]|uniref:RING-H2 finger protein ATL52-like n=1 Tax=Salvia miltiorrhiza TaxID=226208 RepID=UPI0025AD8A8B|nr:RING-H2 finger protein ATL52-like [Salvia miltiorrhiza]
MADPRSSPVIPSPPPSLPRSNSMMLYYGLVVVATAAVVLVLYNLVILRWCADHRPPRRSSRRQQHPTVTWRINDSPANLVASFKYEGDGKGQDGDSECAVCLSVFEQGEEIRQLPNCKHYFHAPCIDMWLYSHMDCPLCRSPVKAEPPPPLHRSEAAAEESEHSREVLLGPGALV